MKTRIIALFLLFVMVSGVTAYASDVSGAVYQATVRITNNSTAASNVAVNFTLDSQYLIDYDFVSDNFCNTAMWGTGGGDVAYMPGSNSTNPWIVYVSSIAEDSQINDTLYMGGDCMDAKLSYFPGTGGMSVNDHASMELGSTFSVNASGYFQAGTITASMSPASTQLTVTGAGDATALSPSTGSNYQCVDETYGSPNDTDYVWTLNDTVLIDYYEIQDGSIPAGAAIDSVTVYFRTKWSDESNYARPYLRLSGTNTAGTEITNTSSFVTYSEVLSRPGGGTWSVSDIADLQVGIGLRAPNGMAYCSQISVVVAYHIEAEASITAGEHDLIVASDGTDLTITIDESEEDSAAAGGASITNNANTWYFAKSGYVCEKSGAFNITGTMLYVESISVDVSGSPAAAWVWQYGSTFEDSVNSNDATPSFRTTSSDAEVSAELMDFEPVAPADIGEYSLEEESYMITDAPDEPDDLFDTTDEEDIEVPETLMPELWDELLEEATIPASFFWIMVAFCTAMAGGLMAYGGVTKLRGETVSFASADSFALFIQALVSGLILVIWIVATGGTVVPAWIMAPYVVIELAAILLVRRGVA